MLAMATLVLYLSHAMPWFFSFHTPVALSAAKLVAVISGVMTLPYYTLVAFSIDLSPISGVVGFEFDALLARFALYYSLGLFSAYLGIACTTKGYHFNAPALAPAREQQIRYDRLMFLFFGLALLFIALKFQAAGGFVFFIQNIQMRSEHLAGTALYDIVIIPTAYLAVFFGLYSRSMIGKPGIITLAIVVISLFVLLAAFGGRKAPMMLVMFTLLAASAFNRKFNLLSPRALVVYFVMVLFFAAALQFRLASQSADGAGDLGVVNIVRNSSYLDTYLFIMHHFSLAEFWYGVGFLDLIDRAFGIYYLPGNVPLDDGVYIRSLYAGYATRPPEAFGNLYQSSWPPESFGNGYLNFGLLGVVLFFFAKGVFSGILFRYAQGHHFAPIPLFVFMYITITFHLSNLRIVQTGLFLVGIAVVWPLVHFFRAGLRRSSG